ncbi:hypothetical protein BPSOL_1099 [Bifidobacterium pseudolongum]|nr:hypothetical protein BPSOL_1099 [Bifidobacterium pseudolongum]
MPLFTAVPVRLLLRHGPSLIGLASVATSVMSRDKAARAP